MVHNKHITPIMRIDPYGNAWWNPFSWTDETWMKIGSGALIVGGAVCMAIPGAQGAGLMLIGAGVGSLVGGEVSEAFGGQKFFANAPVGFVWSVIPYRTEWRYSTHAHKYALIDVGHVCENLYLACEAIGCGACAIGAYNQPLADKLLGFDASPSADKEAEFVVYAAAVGKLE